MTLAAHNALTATTTPQYRGAVYGLSNGTVYANCKQRHSSLESKSAPTGDCNMVETSTNQSLIVWCMDVFHTLNNKLTYIIGNPNQLNSSDDLQN